MEGDLTNLQENFTTSQLVYTNGDRIAFYLWVHLCILCRSLSSLFSELLVSWAAENRNSELSSENSLTIDNISNG